MSEVLLPVRDQGQTSLGRSPFTVLVFAPKGGVGKTTLSTNLAVAAAASSYRVAGLDFDTQRAFASWGVERHERSQSESLVPVTVRGAHLRDWREELRLVRNYDVVVVDTPPRADEDVSTFLLQLGRAADLILMPVDVGPNSIRFVVEFMAWWKARPGCAVFILNKTIAGRTLLREARETLKEFGPVWDESIPQREDLMRLLDLGLGALDSPAYQGRENFVALWQMCSERLKGFKS